MKRTVLIVWVIALLAVTVWPVFAASVDVRNASGDRVGYIDGKDIRNASGSRRGYVDGKDIRNASGSRVGYIDGDVTKAQKAAAGLILLKLSRKK